MFNCPYQDGLQRYSPVRRRVFSLVRNYARRLVIFSTDSSLMYRTIDAKFWSDPKVKKLAPTAKLLFLYLVTNPHTHVSGIYHLPAVVMAYETGLEMADLDTLCDTLSRTGFVRFDTENEVVWVKNMMLYQGIGDKNIRSAAFHLEDLHNSPLVGEFLQKYPLVLTYLKIPHRYPIQKNGAHATPEQEQELTPEQEQERPESLSHFSITAPGLSTEWCHFCSRKKNRVCADAAEDLTPQFAEWLRRGASGEKLLAEIRRKDRDRSEHLWQFKKRMVEQNGQKNEVEESTALRNAKLAEAAKKLGLK